MNQDLNTCKTHKKEDGTKLNNFLLLGKKSNLNANDKTKLIENSKQAVNNFNKAFCKSVRFSSVQRNCILFPISEDDEIRGVE